MKIYNKNGVEILDVNVSDESYRYRTIMGDNSVTLMFSLFEYIEIEIDSYIDYQGEIYTLRKHQIPVMNDTENFDYTALFESAGSLLSKYKFRDYSNRLKFSMTGKPLDFIQAVVHNLNLRDSGWTVGTCIDAVEKTLSFNHTYLNDVIRQVAESFKTEFEIVGKQINLKKLEYNKSNPLALSYGRGNGFKSGIKRDNVGNSKAFEILFVQGGEKNINASKYGSPELLLPKLQSIKYDGSKFEGEEGYISQNSREYISDSLGLSIQRNRSLSTKVEDSVDLSNIYPSRVGSVSTVVVVNADKSYYDITDSSIPDALDYDDCLIAGETMTIIFQSGMLAGREFDCNYNHSARKFEIVPAELDGISMPGGVYVPSVGDKYAIFGIQLPDAYFCDNTTKTGSSWELFKEAVKYFYDNEDEKFSFTGMLDPIWAASDWVNIGGKIVLGGFISFTAEFQQTPVLIRITGIKDFVNFPHKPEIELSNVTSGGGYGSSLKDIPNTETVIQDSKKEIVRFAKRGFRDAQETASMLQNSLLNFSGSINPITLQTMHILLGDVSLQFDFVANQNSTDAISHAESYNPATKKFTSAAGVIQHKTLGITTLSVSHAASEYKWWAVSEYISAVLDDSAKSYYLYAKVSKTENTGVFLLSETAITMEQVPGYYHLFMGILNSENDEDRSYQAFYGFAELSPSRFTVRKIASPDAGMVIDLENKTIVADSLSFKSNGASKSVSTALTETQTAASQDATTKADAAKNAAIQAAQQAADAAKAAAIASSNAYADGEISASEAAVLLSAQQYANAAQAAAETTAKSYADGVVTEAEANANAAAQAYAVAARDAAVVTANAYADGVADAAEQAAIAAAQAKATAAEVAAKAYADGIVTESEQAAITTAKAYADAQAELAELNAKAHADGIVTAEEQRAIADATAKAEAARVAAVNAAAQDATNKQEALMLERIVPSPDFSYDRLGSISTYTRTAKASAPAGCPLQYCAKQSTRDGVFNNMIKVEVGQEFYFDAYLNTEETAHTCGVGFQVFDENYNTITWRKAIELNSGNGWEKVSGEITIESTWRYVRLWSQIDASDNFGNLYITGLTVSDSIAAQNKANQAITELSNQLSYINTIKSDLQNQIDGVVDSWFFPYTPALDNEPASLWTDDTQRGRHVGDTFTNTQVFVSNDQTPDAGKSWRWAYANGVYHWTPIADSDAVKALLAASKAQDTADNKKRVFTVQPFTPYDAGDLWMQGAAGDIMKCDVGRATGAFVASDWGKGSKYTDDTAVNNLQIGSRNLFGFNKGVDFYRANPNKQINGFVGTGGDIRIYKLGITRPGIYTVSFFIKSNYQTQIEIDLCDSQEVFPDVTTEFVKHTFTFLVSGYYTEPYFGFLDFTCGNEIILTVKDLMIVEGNKVVSNFIPAQEDVQYDIDTAKQAADDAQSAADDAANATNNLNNYVVGAFKDGIIDSAEAKAISKYINTVNAEFDSAISAYNAVYTNTYLEGDAKTNLETAKDTFSGLKDTLISAINTAIADGQTTASESAAVNTAYANYRTGYANYTTALENANKAIQAKLDALSTEKVEAVKIADDNLLSGSRFSTTTGWTVDGGTVSAVDEPVFGEKVVEIVRTAQGNFQFGFSYTWSTLNNKDVIFYVIAKQIESGAWNFGGWSETFNTLNNNSSYRELEGGYRLYYARVNVAAVCSSGTFGLNSITGKWRFYACGVALGNTPPAMWTASKTEQSIKAAAAKVLSDAIAQTTEIDGGLALLTALLTRYNNVVSAGIMAKTATNNIALFGGGTVEEAIAKTSKFGVTHDGDAWLRGLIESTSGKIGGLNISNNSLISESMSFSESPVETLAELLNPQTYSIPYQQTWEKEVVIGAGMGDEPCVAYSQNIVLPIDCTLKFKATCIPDSNGIAGSPEDTGYSIYVNGTNGRVYTKSGVGSIYGYTVSINLPAGTYTIYAQAETLLMLGGEETSTNYARIYGVASEATIVATGFVNKSKIGNNGLFSFWDALKYFYFSSEQGVSIRHQCDIPAGIGGGRISSSGIISGLWGILTKENRGVVKSGSNYVITHYIGDTDYSVILTPKSTSVPYFLDANRINNVLTVTCAGGFDFVLIRTK